MTITETSPSRVINIEALSFTSGAHLLLKRALRELPASGRLGVRASTPDFAVHLRGWCREQGHEFVEGDDQFVAWIVRGAAAGGRWRQAERAGLADARENDAVRAAPPADWGFASRGAAIEPGGPAFHYALRTKDQVWAENVPKLYAQAAAAQWSLQTAINWDEPFALDEEMERAVAQVMTYLIENEMAALQVPALLIHTSTAPKRSRAVANSRSSSSPRVTSQPAGWTAAWLRPTRRRSAASRAASSRRPVTTTEQPRSKKAAASPYPMPRVLPVTTTAPIE